MNLTGLELARPRPQRDRFRIGSDRLRSAGARFPKGSPKQSTQLSSSQATLYKCEDPALQSSLRVISTLVAGLCLEPSTLILTWRTCDWLTRAMFGRLNLGPSGRLQNTCQHTRIAAPRPSLPAVCYAFPTQTRLWQRSTVPQQQTTFGTNRGSLLGQPLPARPAHLALRQNRRKSSFAAAGRDAPLADRLAASLVYLVPLMDGLRYGDSPQNEACLFYLSWHDL